MLDRKHLIVAEHAQRRDELPPPLFAVPVAAGAENPRPIPLVGVWFGVQHPGPRQILRVDLRVLRVHIKYRVAEHSYRRNGVNPLPKQMAGIQIRPHRRPRNLAQPQQRLRVVHHESGMHFDGDLHAMFRRKFPMRPPVGRYNLFPLPLQNLQIVRRPRARHPVWRFRFSRIARTSRKIHDHRHFQLLCQQDRFAADFPRLSRPRFVGMQSVTVTT